MDTFTKRKRSQIMAAVRSQGNRATELKVVTLLRQAGVTGWRRKRKLLGNPDFVFQHSRVAVFVDGCFWHGCKRCYRRPGSHRQYWDSKIARNKARDRFVNRELRKQGWKVVRIWEHELGAGGIRRRRGYGGQGSHPPSHEATARQGRVVEKIRRALGGAVARSQKPGARR